MIVTAFCFVGCTGDDKQEVQQPAQQPVQAKQSREEPQTSDAGNGNTQDISVEVAEEVLEDQQSFDEPYEEQPARESAKPDDGYDSSLADKHVRIRLADSGSDVFALWGTGRPDYRYGPSIMYTKNGGVDAWFASPGDGKKEYDWITYRPSGDGGKTWGREKVVLAPTPGTSDFKSVCDPDVFYYDGYYYMGYTATVNKDGLCNTVFLARSENPDGPYLKWTGDGWGDIPMPIIYFKGVDIGWGVGEPSFVVVDDTVYVYNTLDSFSDKYGWVRATEVRTADITDPMWPANLEYKGIAIYRNDATDKTNYTYADSDSWNVAYLDECHKFIALTTNRRFKDDSCLLYYESDDGINFERVSEINTDVIAGCHNCGLMSNEAGHIGKNDPKLIGYAYAGSEGSKWGVWATRFAPISIDYTDDVDREEEGTENLKEPIKIDESLLGGGSIMLVTDQLSYTTPLNDNPIPIRYYVMSVFRIRSSIDSSKINFERYDHDMLKVNENNQLVPLREGMSIVGIEYEGLRRDICIRVVPDDYDDTEIRYFFPICKRLDISMNEPVIVKIRPMAVYKDYDIEELSGYEMNVHNISFRSSNPSVCTVKKDGTVTPVGPGASVITVRSEDCKYTVDVYVSE